VTERGTPAKFSFRPPVGRDKIANMTGTGPTPGWYKDGMNPDLERWWDGFAWTPLTRELSAAPPPVLPPPSGAHAAPPSTPPIPPAAHPAPAVRGKRKRWPWVIAAAVLLLVVVIAINSKSKPATTAATTTVHTSAPRAAAAPASQAAPAVPAAPKQTSEQKYVAAIKQDADHVQVDVQIVQLAASELANGSGGVDINTMAVEAQTAHDDLVNIKDDFISHNWPGSFDNQAAEANDAINSLKNSMGTVVAYCGDQNPATLARFSSQFNQAVPEWNDAVTTMWTKAGVANPPTL
jgi:hypothetical protein